MHEMPQVLRNAERIEYVDPPIADPDAESANEDRRERAIFAARAEMVDRLPIARLAFLTGDHVTTFGSGTICRALVAEAQAGRLRLASGSLTRRANGQKRAPPSAEVTRTDWREWLEAFGDDAARTSPAAAWCGFTPKETK